MAKVEIKASLTESEKTIGRGIIIEGFRHKVYNSWSGIQNSHEVYELVSRAMFERKNPNKKVTKGDIFITNNLVINWITKYEA
jgi:hypothetical protein